MGFFDSIGKKVADAGQRTKEMTDVARLDMQVKREEGRLNQLYTRIGKQYVELHPEDHEEAFADMFREYREITQAIQDYNQQIEQIKGGWNAPAPVEEPVDPNARKCPNCGAVVSETSSFCRFCGSPIPQKEEAPAEDEGKFCINCGEKLASDAVFCVKCGAKQA